MVCMYHYIVLQCTGTIRQTHDYASEASLGNTSNYNMCINKTNTGEIQTVSSFYAMSSAKAIASLAEDIPIRV